MNKLKNIFALKEKEVEEIPNDINEEAKDFKITFFESGYGSSKSANGNPFVYKACLNNVYMDYKGKCRENENLQNEFKKPYKEEKGKVEIELKKRSSASVIIEESIQKEESNILTFSNDIVEVKNNPEKFGLDVDKKPKAQFYLGLAVIIPITFYLLVFYISASYSAFFKNFESEELAAAIFDGKALTKAINDGWLEGVFIATIPFAFMGLGYLIHMFQKHKHWMFYFKISLLFFIAFVFDAILAYQIEMKIYNIEKTPDSLPFDINIAFTSVEFWGIIFAGFVVYIIWGLVFDFIMKEYDNFDKIKGFIKTRKEDIKNAKLNISRLEQKLDPIKEEIFGLQGKINDLQRTIDGFIFSDKHYLTYHAEYVKGWYLAITDHLPLKRADDILEKCVEVEKQHLVDHSIANNNSEGVLYKLNKL